MPRPRSEGVPEPAVEKGQLRGQSKMGDDEEVSSIESRILVESRRRGEEKRLFVRYTRVELASASNLACPV
jgi:hypothetical protein